MRTPRVSTYNTQRVLIIDDQSKADDIISLEVVTPTDITQTVVIIISLVVLTPTVTDWWATMLATEWQLAQFAYLTTCHLQPLTMFLR
jgi:hypothetical protein